MNKWDCGINHFCVILWVYVITLHLTIILKCILCPLQQQRHIEQQWKRRKYFHFIIVYASGSVSFHLQVEGNTSTHIYNDKVGINYCHKYWVRRGFYFIFLHIMWVKVLTSMYIVCALVYTHPNPPQIARIEPLSHNFTCRHHVWKGASVILCVHVALAIYQLVTF